MTVVSQYLAYQQQLESGGSSHYQFPWDLPSQTCPQSGDLVPDILVSWREVSSTDNSGQCHSETLGHYQSLKIIPLSLVTFPFLQRHKFDHSGSKYVQCLVKHIPDI